MNAIVLLLALSAGPPTFEPEPMPNIVPAFLEGAGGRRVLHRPGVCWSRLPGRKTKWWNGVSGLLFCDDPDDDEDNTHVYPPGVAPDRGRVAPVRRAKE